MLISSPSRASNPVSSGIAKQQLPIWVHIGLAKTGTTSLQRCVFSQHPQILYLGKEIDKEYVVNHPLYHVARKSQRAFDLAATRARFAEMIAAGQSCGIEKRVCLLSEEALTGYRALNPAICASRVRDIFPNARILLVLREPYQWLESMYFFRLSLRFPETLDGFNQWLKASLSRPEVGTDLGVLHVGTIAMTWATLFGEDRISVMFYEAFRSDAASFITEICREMDLDSDEAVRLYNLHNKSAKKRITKRQEEFCSSFRLVRDGQYVEYLARTLPLLETAGKRDRATVKSMIPADLSAERSILQREFLSFSRVVDTAARAFLGSGEQANVTWDGGLRACTAQMIEPGLRFIATRLGVPTDHYIDSANCGSNMNS